MCKPALTGHPDLGTPSLCVSATSLQQPGALRKMLWLPPSQLRLWKEEGTRALHLCCVYQKCFPKSLPSPRHLSSWPELGQWSLLLARQSGKTSLSMGPLAVQTQGFAGQGLGGGAPGRRGRARVAEGCEPG